MPTTLMMRPLSCLAPTVRQGSEARVRASALIHREVHQQALQEQAARQMASAQAQLAQAGSPPNKRARTHGPLVAAAAGGRPARGSAGGGESCAAPLAHPGQGQLLCTKHGLQEEWGPVMPVLSPCPADPESYWPGNPMCCCLAVRNSLLQQDEERLRKVWWLLSWIRTLLGGEGGGGGRGAWGDENMQNIAACPCSIHCLLEEETQGKGSHTFIPDHP